MSVLFFLNYSHGEVLKVGLYNSKEITSFSVKSNKGTYTAVGSKNSVHLKPNTWYKVYYNSSAVYINGILVGDSASFFSQSIETFFSVKSNQHHIPEAVFKGDLLVRARNQKLVLVNIIDMETYLQGVIESESGKNQNLEYYKAQAIISRTWTLKNQRKHQHQGFNLCNEVHCQAYKSMARFNDDIILATEETRGVVLVDCDIDLIHATYHSNCGGQTANSEEVWSEQVSYLRSVRDTFCLAGDHHSWHITVSKDKWKNVLQNEFGLYADQSLGLMNFYPQQRMPAIETDTHSILTKDIRYKMNLKSAYFSINTEGQETEFAGKGFGHGVGLCQEGAMEMSRRGYPFFDILLFYYKNVHLVHSSYIDFFKED